MKKMTSVKLKGWDLEDDSTVLIGARLRGTTPRRLRLAKKAKAGASSKKK